MLLYKTENHHITINLADIAQYKPTAIYLLSSVIFYAIFGAINAKWSIIIIQRLPAVVAIIVVILLMCD